MEYIGPRIIDLMGWKDFINGLDLKIPNDYNHICTRYAYRKSHRKPMLGTSETKYSKIELVVMDLTSSISVPTWNSYVYALVVEVNC